MICTGCSLLCDDIEIDFRGEEITTYRHICQQGYTLLNAAQSARQTAQCLVKGQKSALEKSLSNAAKLLRQARKPLFWGLDNTTLDAQIKGLKMAYMLGATVACGSTSDFESIHDAIMKGILPTCTLEEVRAHADVIIYWGTNPHRTHPRHLSRFTYYPLGETVQRGWEMERQLVCIDVQATEMESISKIFINLTAGEEPIFLTSFSQALAGKKAPDPRINEMLDLLQKAKYPVVFVGRGLAGGLGEDIDSLCQMAKILNQVKFIPMVTSFNQRGFYHTMFTERSYGQHGPTCTQVDQFVARNADCCLMIGVDPLAKLAQPLYENLRRIPLIVFDPLATEASSQAQVMIRTDLAGLSGGGGAIRQDGVKVNISSVLPETEFKDTHIFELLRETLQL